MESEARIALVDLIVVVVGPQKCGAQLGSGIELAESLEGVVRVERALGGDEKVRLTCSGIVAVDLPGSLAAVGDSPARFARQLLSS